jgi:hypothetical protein
MYPMIFQPTDWSWQALAIRRRRPKSVGLPERPAGRPAEEFVTSLARLQRLGFSRTGIGMEFYPAWPLIYTIELVKGRHTHHQEDGTVDQSRIFAPFIGVMLLTLVVWLYMYARRLPFIISGKFTPQQLTPVEFARLSPPQVANPSDNLKNLFELPAVFYAVTLYLYLTNQVDTPYLIAAWVFCGFRVLHSFVHCTFNYVPLRFWLYAIAALALWLMVVRIAVAVLF